VHRREEACGWHFRCTCTRTKGLAKEKTRYERSGSLWQGLRSSRVILDGAEVLLEMGAKPPIQAWLNHTSDNKGTERLFQPSVSQLPSQLFPEAPTGISHTKYLIDTCLPRGVCERYPLIQILNQRSGRLKSLLPSLPGSRTPAGVMGLQKLPSYGGMGSRKQNTRAGVTVYACNLSYPRGRDWDDHSSRPPWARS
jgi:hypothetical protein